MKKKDKDNEIAVGNISPLEFIPIPDILKNEINETLKLIYESLERIHDVMRDMRGR